MTTCVSRAGRSRYHHSGAAKSCTRCGDEFRRTANMSATEWESRQYCGTACSNHARSERRRQHHGTPVARVSRVALATILASQPGGWEQFGACRDHPDRDLWFADIRVKKAAADKARTLCAGCPVRQPCLDYALAVREPWGIWGGLNASERRALLNRRTATYPQRE